MLEASGRTLFGKSNKGLARQLTSAKALVLADVAAYKAAASDYDEKAGVAQIEAELADDLRLAQITVIEAKMIQTLKDQKMTIPNKTFTIQAEIDGLLDAGLTSVDILPALYDKCMEALRM